ncbi:hypothetical protein [Halobacterium zhouii]|uniref:hypothetical protein n=1 Tax=Halobacterium zhouii TaxID=2902624 RepID=UPI001E4C4D71|nr:hypothetical protein [Halobacterium zhouii]
MDSISPESVRIAGNYSNASGALATFCGLFGLRGKLMERLGHVVPDTRSAYRLPGYTSPSYGLSP